MTRPVVGLPNAELQAFVAKALREGRLGGAALDALAQEPAPADRWRDVPNCLLTPRAAGVTGLAFAQMVAEVAGNLDAFFTGRPLTGQVALPA